MSLKISCEEKLNSRKKLDASFYSKPATVLAEELLGKYLCRNINGETLKLKITETECYFGEEDTACHAHKGKTKRTEIMYYEGGFAYVYLCYGIHNLLNVVTGEKDHPEAVLIRGVDGYNGPGKLTKAMNIDRSLNGENLITSNKLWIEKDGNDTKDNFEVKKAKRIGIGYASEEDKNKMWRFIKIEN
ncbi:MAG: DNA-3-methyladenine glycosylase [Clostridioides sp.]|jgi:DNA-3-methyladenine glycosylase|nr:DNA-3-methyladenine glycosylase [Clostridioides sp.]